jgi:hypothetical protein
MPPLYHARNICRRVIFTTFIKIAAFQEDLFLDDLWVSLLIDLELHPEIHPAQFSLPLEYPAFHCDRLK